MNERNEIYYKARIHTQQVAVDDDGATMPQHIVELAFHSEDGYEVYDRVNVGFDPADAEALAKAWRENTHMRRVIMTCLESK